MELPLVQYVTQTSRRKWKTRVTFAPTTAWSATGRMARQKQSVKPAVVSRGLHSSLMMVLVMLVPRTVAHVHTVAMAPSVPQLGVIQNLLPGHQMATVMHAQMVALHARTTEASPSVSTTNVMKDEHTELWTGNALNAQICVMCATSTKMR